MKNKMTTCDYKRCQTGWGRRKPRVPDSILAQMRECSSHFHRGAKIRAPIATAAFGAPRPTSCFPCLLLALHSAPCRRPSSRETKSLLFPERIHASLWLLLFRETRLLVMKRPETRPSRATDPRRTDSLASNFLGAENASTAALGDSKRV